MLSALPEFFPSFGQVFWLLTGLYAAVHVVFLWLVLRNWAEGTPGEASNAELPMASVLVAARNEAPGILNTLAALAAQDYPPERFQVLIGDDASTDATAELVRGFIADRPNFQLVAIAQNAGGLRGKQNVLAQLAQHTSGEVLLFTDADVRLPPSWARNLAAAFADPSVGVAGAPTIVEDRGPFAALQTLDWLYGVTAIQALARVQLPVTVAGNNMAVRRTAYDELGGYAALPFSLTEDFLLFIRVVRAGWEFRWLHRPSVLGRSAAVRGLPTYLHQRKRWFRGGLAGPWYALALFGLQAALLPVLVAGAFVLYWKNFLTGLLLKVAADWLLLGAAALQLRRPKLLLWLPVYPLFFVVNIAMLSLWFAWPGKVNWKGRTY